jgi:hypothetical protein
MKATNKLKYVLNFRSSDITKGRGNWQCDKCQVIFFSFRELRLHKKDIHSY